MTTNIYLDTEFSRLEADAKLISVGAITESGDTFYVELTPRPAELSEFVQLEVLLFLEGAPAECPRDDFPARFESWLAQLPNPRIIVDSRWDVMLLRQTLMGTISWSPGELTVGSIPAQIDLTPPHPSAEYECYRVARKAQLLADPRRHHALADAGMLRAVCLARQDWK